MSNQIAERFRRLAERTVIFDGGGTEIYKRECSSTAAMTN